MTKNQTPQIGVAYIRESTEEQDKGFSPQAQEKAIKSYAKQNNVEITRIYKDLRSGRDASKRNEFMEMIDDALQKKFETILVFHTSRFARNVSEARQYKTLLRKKGISVIFVTQNFGDSEDPSAFLNEGINELFDEHGSRQIAFWVKSACMEKRSQGKQNGNPPLGYYKKEVGFDEEKGRPIYTREWLTHKKEAKLVNRIFTMYATGKYSMASIANILTAEGLKTKYGNAFTYSSLKGLLSNRVYLGLVSSPRKKHLADVPSTNHKAILSQELFDRCQERIAENRNVKGRPVAQHRFYLLQGLLFCDHCLERISKEEKTLSIRPMLPTIQCHTDVMTTKSKGKQEKYFYRCKTERENKMCTQEKVQCSVIDKQVIQYMNGFQVPEDVIEMTLDNLRKMFVVARKEPKTDKRITAVLEQRSRINTMFKVGEIDENQYLLDLEENRVALKHLERLDIIQHMNPKQENNFLLKTEEFLREFPEFLRTHLEEAEFRDWILMTIKRIWIRDKKVVKIEPRDDFKPLFKAYKKVIAQAPLVTPVCISLSFSAV